jgi:glycosyltransferase involved in cell wall biosynthesis
MRVAFYAPLKPPGHRVPSGDRRLARLLLRAIAKSGNTVSIASRMRAFDGSGDPARQHRIRQRGAALARRFIERHRHDPPDLWFTYHLYHKAPDWIGPVVADAFSIPYVVAEASMSPKQAAGPWRMGHDGAVAAIRRANRIIVLNPGDRACLEPLVRHHDTLVDLAPFIDTAKPRRAARHRARSRAALAAQHAIAPTDIWIAVNAMMRPGDKLDSYKVLGRAMTRLTGLPLQWLIVGDGPARSDVARALGTSQITYLGMLDAAGVDALHAAADLAVWPALREAFGMALLEAQAAGLPVIAGASPGVARIVADGQTGLLTPAGDDTMLATAIRNLANDPNRRRAMGHAAMHKAEHQHDIDAAATAIGRVLHDARARA